MLSYRSCTLCPRRCGVDREAGELGFCRMPGQLRAARAMLHYGEEPPICANYGTGAVFFSGCTLRCRYCQNGVISTGGAGEALTPEALRETFLRLSDEGAQSIDLVTPTHFLPSILPALTPRLPVPVIYNCGGYESMEILHMLDGLVDIYLPDLKFYEAGTAKAYAGCPDYFTVAAKAIAEMHRQAGTLRWKGALLQRGLMVRHLVLPGHRKESIALLHQLAELLPADAFLLSLMGQYTPPEQHLEDPFLNRRIATFEYESVRKCAVQLGLNGYGQDRSSATASYTPDFWIE